MQYLKDIQVGTIVELGPETFVEADMIRFAEKFDRQVFHLDPEAAKNTFYGELIACGWHTASVYMKLLVAWFQEEDRKCRDQGLPLAQRSASPGLLDIRWPNPVRAGDKISYRSEITNKRTLKSRPGWGIMTMHTTADNQDGERVLEMTGYTIMEWEKPKS